MKTPEWVELREINKRGLFDKAQTLDEVLQISIDSLNAYGAAYKHWIITYSGGKDSSATVAFVLYAIESGLVSPPERLTIIYADTGIELPPLSITAERVLDAVRKRGYEAIKVQAPIENRLYVKMLGYGYPYPTNRRRWCTRLMKKEPMEQALNDTNALTITGVRLGESTARDERITTSCSTSDGECGQGWYQQQRNALAPLVHWRVCNVWRWLFDPRIPLPELQAISDVYAVEQIYGGDLRTGCIKCQVITEDKSFNMLVRKKKWQWLAPLHELDELHAWLGKPAQRLRKVDVSKKADGSLRDRTNAPLGPIHLDARRKGLDWILDIQRRTINNAPDEFKHWRLITDEEVVAIRQMIAEDIYPGDWKGTEPHGDEAYEATIVIDGVFVAKQLLLPNFHV